MSAIGEAFQSQSFHNELVYFSLMADQFVRVLLHRVPQTSPAILNGYHRYSIKGRVYPAILPVENKKVSGREGYLEVLMGITDPELNILDEFEDVEYERSTAEVSLLVVSVIKDSSLILLVNAYVWSNKNDPNLYEDLDFEELACIEAYNCA